MALAVRPPEHALARAAAGLLRAVVETFRVFLFHLSPGTESIVATLRFGGLEEAEEERPSEHEVILRYPPGEPRITLERLVALLDRYHPSWRRLVTLSSIARA